MLAPLKPYVLQDKERTCSGYRRHLTCGFPDIIDEIRDLNRIVLRQHWHLSIT
jgi:hypothetical protein